MPSKSQSSLPTPKPTTHGAASLADILGTRAPVKVKPEWKPYQVALIKLRTDIESDLSERVAMYREGISAMGGGDEIDQASNEQMGAATTNSLKQLQDTLREIENALQRIQRGTYGVCEITGEAIDPARLAVIPYTRYSQVGEATVREERRRLRDLENQPIEDMSSDEDSEDDTPVTKEVEEDEDDEVEKKREDAELVMGTDGDDVGDDDALPVVSGEEDDEDEEPKATKKGKKSKTPEVDEDEEDLDL